MEMVGKSDDTEQLFLRPTEEINREDCLGTGSRNKLINELPLYMIDPLDRDRSVECENNLDKKSTDYSKDYRMLKVVPSFLKWPIWRAKPKRHTSIEPKSFKQLEEDTCTFAAKDKLSTDLGRYIYIHNHPLVCRSRNAAACSFLAKTGPPGAPLVKPD